MYVKHMTLWHYVFLSLCITKLVIHLFKNIDCDIFSYVYSFYIYVYVYMYSFMCTVVYIYIYIYMCVCVSIMLFMNTHKYILFCFKFCKCKCAWLASYEFIRFTLLVCLFTVNSDTGYMNGLKQTITS